ncbi:MAG: SDR family oxidoreductase, partial [Deltaproteobacteria bacterium]|nr:SDR family oxidoreductase [Deltaproteobacteria bacterium]
QKKGKIINIGSIAGLMAHTMRSMPYAASKAGVHQVTRTFAAELAEHGVNVNSIAPTWVNTPMVQGKDPSYYENIYKMTPFGRMLEPIELVGAAIFLASDASSFVTGQVINVDGGWSCSKALT